MSIPSLCQLSKVRILSEASAELMATAFWAQLESSCDPGMWQRNFKCSSEIFSHEATRRESSPANAPLICKALTSFISGRSVMVRVMQNFCS